MADVTVPALDGLQFTTDEIANAPKPDPVTITPEEADKELTDQKLEDSRAEKRVLAEKLEKDPVFKAQYIKEQNIRIELAKVKALQEKMAREKEIEEIKATPALKTAADLNAAQGMEALPEPEAEKSGRQVFYINKVEIGSVVFNIKI